MGECEFTGDCPFFNDQWDNMPENAEEMKTQYCKTNNLNCALYMIITSLGTGALPSDMAPPEKIRAYEAIAENS